MIRLRVQPEYRNLESKLRYVLQVFELHYSPEREIEIEYGGDENSGIRIAPGTAHIFFRSGQPVPQEIHWLTWKDVEIPILFSGAQSQFSDQGIFKRSEDGHLFQIQYDILSSAFYFLSCYQERESQKEDRFGRFPLEESLLYNLGMLEIPVVNYYFDILAEAIRIHGGKEVRRRGTAQPTFTASVTHDIDRCKTGWGQNAFRALLAGQLPDLWSVVKQRMQGRDVWFNFPQMIQLEAALDLSASYYFIDEQRKIDGVKHADYDLHAKDMLSVLDQLREAGHEIGIHGSYGSGWKMDKLRGEVEEFPVPVTGGRFHYLALQVPESFHRIEEAGLSYDTSLGFAEHMGFRSGFCLPYPPFNFQNEEAFNFIEYPLVLMDTTLIKNKYMGLTPDTTLDRFASLLSEIQRFSGHLVMLWHNAVFTGYKYREWLPVFRRIIRFTKENSGEFVTLAGHCGSLKKHM